MTWSNYLQDWTDTQNRKAEAIRSKPRQKTYIFRYGLDGENTKTVKASNKKDALWLAKVSHITSCQIIK